jgi:hypothetical protein
VVGNQVERIYARGAQRSEPRRLLMEAWADFCDRTEPVGGDNVVALGQVEGRRNEEMSQTETIIDEMPLQPILCSVQQGCLSFSSTVRSPRNGLLEARPSA